MRILRDKINEDIPNVIKAYNIFSSMKNVLPAHEEYLAFCKAVIPYLNRPEQATFMANRMKQ